MMDLSKKRIYFLTLISQFFSFITTMIVSLVSVTLYINFLSLESYSLWILINSLLGYFAIFGFGINSASSILINISENAHIKFNIFKKSLLLVLITTFLILSLYFLLTFIFPNWIVIVFPIPSNLLNEVSQSTNVLIIFFLINIPFSIVNSAFNGFYKVYINNFLSIINSLLLLISIILLISLNGNLIILAYLISFSNLLVNLIRTFLFLIFYNNYKNSENLNSKPKNFHFVNYRQIFNLGIFTMIGVSFSLIVGNSDNILISNFVGNDELISFSTTYKLFLIVFSMIYVFNSSIIPLIGTMAAKKQFYELNLTYKTTYKLIQFASGAFWLLSFIIFKPLIYFWVGPIGFSGYLTLFLLGLYSFIYSINNLNNIILNTLNLVKESLWILGAEAIIKIISSFILVRLIGINGVVVGTLVGAFIGPFINFPKLMKSKLSFLESYTFVYSLKYMLVILPFFIVSFFIDQLNSSLFYTAFLSIIIFLLYSTIFYFRLTPNDRHYIKYYFKILLIKANLVN